MENYQNQQTQILERKPTNRTNDEMKKLSDFIYDKDREEFYPDEVSLREKFLGKKVSGYEIRKVEEFLEKVALKAKYLEAENEKMKNDREVMFVHHEKNFSTEESEELVEKLRLADETLLELESMINTHREILKDAAAQKEKILKKAREEEAEMKHRATREIETRIKELNRQIDEKERKLMSMSEKEQVFASRMSEMVELVEEEIKVRLTEAVSNVKESLNESVHAGTVAQRMEA